jgi:DNA mismatch endonuclease (patch repair protein)
MRGSKLEIAFRQALHARGLRFYVSYRKAPGRPDVAFPSRRLAVFVDGDVWHGLPGRRIPDAWRRQVDANQRRDQEVNAKLEADGWTVLRLWERDIRRSLDACVERVTRAARQ